MVYLVIFLIALVVNLFSILFAYEKRIFMDEADKPQRFHSLPMPRIGGFGIVAAFFMGLLYYKFLTLNFILAILPVALVGFYEDLKNDINPKIRLVLISLATILYLLVFKSYIKSVGFFDLPIWIAVPLTVVAISGITNSINFIDGINGLASGFALLAITAIGVVSYIYKDQFMIRMSLITFSSILGFFVLNFPKSKIFLGDGGAYFIGFVLSVLSIFLINRIDAVSPWFIMVILTYPAYDVLFSIYRRKFVKGFSPLKADKFHLHSLLYKRGFRNNSLTSQWILLFLLPFDVFAICFHNNHYVLIGLSLTIMIIYTLFYKKIIKFKLIR